MEEEYGVLDLEEHKVEERSETDRIIDELNSLQHSMIEKIGKSFKSDNVFNSAYAVYAVITNAIEHMRNLRFALDVCETHVEEMIDHWKWLPIGEIAPGEGEVVDVMVLAQADDPKVRPAERIPNAFVENGVWHYTDFSGRVHRIWRTVTHWRHIPALPSELEAA